MAKSIEVISKLLNTVHQLRAPGGCPWDRAQTHQTLRPYLIEEAYEVLDAIDAINKVSDGILDEKAKNSFREELGDLLLQVLIHSEIAAEEGAFDVYDVADTLREKLIRRHPHVFGELKADSAETAYQRWEKQKAAEKAAHPEQSILAGLPSTLPALQRAARMIEKVSRVGFQWKTMHGPVEKIEEELKEFKAEVLSFEKAPPDSPEANAIIERVEAELGDLLFTLANVSYLMKISPEDALRGTLARFQERFQYVERKIKEQGKSLEQSTLEEMDVFWNQAKQKERK